VTRFIREERTRDKCRYSRFGGQQDYSIKCLKYRIVKHFTAPQELEKSGSWGQSTITVCSDDARLRDSRSGLSPKAWGRDE
jgi:hypothetical protein